MNMAQHDDPSLAYADYFAAGGGGGGGGGALVPEAEAGDDDGLYGAVHQHGEAMFGVRGLVVPAEMAAVAHGKQQAALGDFFVLGDHAQQYHGQGHQQPPLTSLSLHGPSEAASLMLHHHQHQQQLGGGAHQQYHHPVAWPKQAGAWHLRGSSFLLPVQQLLQEFCSLPVEATSPAAASKPPTKPANEDGGTVGSGSSSLAPSAQIQAMDAAELQRLKGKLHAMLEEVDRRYRRYREQMRAVAGSFEAVAGERAAAAYTRLASRTISRHFRSLRDGVAVQMQAVRVALGEKDNAGSVSAKAETTTPRLRALDQCLRQRRAFQTGVLESQPWRPQRGLPERAVSILRAWLFEHFLHPYPSDVDKHILARQTGLSRSQVSNWFINARVRLWKPMVEDMYTEEMKDEQQLEASGGGGSTPSSYASEGRCRGKEEGGSERKPTRAQLHRHDAGSLASVVSVGNRDQNVVSFGMMDDDQLDFDAYDVVDGHAGHHGFGGGGGGVSLTLGLQQHADDDPHGAGGVNVAFAGAPEHEFLFMGGGEQQMVAGGGGVHSGGHSGHHHGQFGAGGGGEAVSRYHGGLGATGFQFLHDLAG